MNHGSVPKIHENLFVNKKKIGVMKSKVDNYILALLRTDFIEENKEFSLDLHGTKGKNHLIFFLRFACAAANFAIGILKGEQET